MVYNRMIHLHDWLHLRFSPPQLALASADSMVTITYPLVLGLTFATRKKLKAIVH